MSMQASLLRASRVWSKPLKRLSPLPSTTTTTRSFHSPFVVLGNSNSNTQSSAAPSIASANTNTNTSMYEKQVDYNPDPVVHGQTTYVVSEPNPANTHYNVPAGAYPTSLPYVNFTATEAPKHEGEMSSTSSSVAHPVLTKAVPQNESGVGESSAVRHHEAPGAMGQRGGSYGGKGLVDESSTRPGKGSLPDRNPPPA